MALSVLASIHAGSSTSFSPQYCSARRAAQLEYLNFLPRFINDTETERLKSTFPSDFFYRFRQLATVSQEHI
jgi:hypothetical protein